MERPDYRLEQSGAVLKHFPLQILHENVRLQTGAVLKHLPLQILCEKIRLQTGAVLELFSFQIPLQILAAPLQLFKKNNVITSFSWHGYLCFTDLDQKCLSKFQKFRANEEGWTYICYRCPVSWPPPPRGRDTPPRFIVFYHEVVLQVRLPVPAASKQGS